MDRAHPRGSFPCVLLPIAAVGARGARAAPRPAGRTDHGRRGADPWGALAGMAEERAASDRGAAWQEGAGMPPCPLPPALAGDEIHLCHLALQGALAPHEVRARAHAVLMALLGHYTGAASPLRLAHGPHGKPYAPQAPDLHFNLSHAGCHVLLGFARGQPLGVDIEWRERRVQVRELARRFFAAGEAEALEGLAAHRQRSAFLHLWTHKEAVLKALGVGLSFGLDRLEFALDDCGAVTALTAIDPDCGAVAEWQLHAVRPAPGVEGALAWRGPPRRVRLFALASR